MYRLLFCPHSGRHYRQIIVLVTIQINISKFEKQNSFHSCFNHQEPWMLAYFVVNRSISLNVLTSFCFSSARFEGSLNMDLNEIAINMVPFPRLHYLVSSLTPLYTLADVNVPNRRYFFFLSVIVVKVTNLLRSLM